MHIALAVFTIFTTWKWSDWRNWRQYQSTMLYMLSVGMIHEFLTVDYEFWYFKSDVSFIPGKIVVLIYSVIIMPLSVLIYLSTYPETSNVKRRTSKLKPILHIGIWIAIYMIVEIVEYIFGRITYDHGWDLWDSLLFDAIMFPMLRLHYKNPLLAYLISVLVIVCYLIGFKVPLDNSRSR